MNYDLPGRRSDSTDPRALRTRKALVDAVLRLLNDHEVADLNVSQIVKEAGVSRQVFYQHFADRDALILAAAADWVLDAYERFAERFEIDQNFEASVVELASVVDGKNEAAVRLIDSPVHTVLDNEVQRVMQDTMREQLLPRAKQWGDADAELVADMSRVYVAGIQRLIEQCVREGCTAEEIGRRAEAVRRVLIRE
ncbi:TetR family transcriptional regulator [Corynebacterium afermentans subsp. lipophilum]|uniref:TetR/AcrR family transcriptional regulator n=1 Tax=Corynebacterium afermentans TaxID=38286 RepID=UPI00188B4F13|nr:TetR family transcriptional regulator [Corynebacterium afermentans]MBF4547295.1 TetR family transcriptional regulator [Corynebacterium afermentans subsp. lipophilum]WJY57855.1 transcriptional regulator BetI [Corynebacterium afermentans subsp. lipophilum]